MSYAYSLLYQCAWVNTFQSCALASWILRLETNYWINIQNYHLSILKYQSHHSSRAHEYTQTGEMFLVLSCLMSPPLIYVMHMILLSNNVSVIFDRGKSKNSWIRRIINLSIHSWLASRNIGRIFCFWPSYMWTLKGLMYLYSHCHLFIWGNWGYA